MLKDQNWISLNCALSMMYSIQIDKMNEKLVSMKSRLRTTVVDYRLHSSVRTHYNLWDNKAHNRDEYITTMYMSTWIPWNLHERHWFIGFCFTKILPVVFDYRLSLLLTIFRILRQHEMYSGPCAMSDRAQLILLNNKSHRRIFSCHSYIF